MRELWLDQSPDLRCINLMCSKVGEPCICRLHVVLDKLSNLEVLSLASNELTSLPTALWERSALQKLDLSNNQLTEIPAEILKLQQLQEVNVCGNPGLDTSLLLAALPSLSALIKNRK